MKDRGKGMDGDGSRGIEEGYVCEQNKCIETKGGGRYFLLTSPE